MASTGGPLSPSCEGELEGRSGCPFRAQSDPHCATDVLTCEERACVSGPLELVWAVLVGQWGRRAPSEARSTRSGEGPRRVDERSGPPLGVWMNPPVEMRFHGEADPRAGVDGCRWWRLRSQGPLRTEILHGGCVRRDDRVGEDALAGRRLAEAARAELRRQLVRDTARLRIEVYDRQD